MFTFQLSYGIGDILWRNYFDLSIFTLDSAIALGKNVTLFANRGANLTATNESLENVKKSCVFICPKESIQVPIDLDF